MDDDIEDLEIDGSRMDTETEAELNALLEVVDELITEGKLGRGVDILDGSERRFAKNKDSQMYVKFLVKKAQLFILRSRWAEARDLYDQAAEIVNRHEDQSQEWKIYAQDIYIGISKMSWRLGDYELAEDMAVRAISYSETEDARMGQGYIELGNIKGERGDREDSIAYYLKAIRILEKIDCKDELTRAYNNISDSYYKAEDFDRSVEYADKCIAMAKDFDNTRQAGFGYMTGGEAYLKMGNAKKAKEYIEEAKKLLIDSDEGYVRGCLYTVQGMLGMEEENFEEARDALEKAREYLEETDIRYYLARVYHEFGTLEEKEGNLKEARQFYENALEILTQDKCIQETLEVQEHLKGLKEIEKE